MLDDSMRGVKTAPAAEIDAKLERLARRAAPLRKKLADLDAQTEPLRKKLDDIEIDIGMLKLVRRRRAPAGSEASMPVRTSGGNVNGHRALSITAAERSETARRFESPTTASNPGRVITLGAPNDPTGRKQLLLDRFGHEPAGFEFRIGDALTVIREFEPNVKRRAVEMMLKRMASENDLLVKVAVGRYRLAPQAFAEPRQASGEVFPGQLR